MKKVLVISYKKSGKSLLFNDLFVKAEEMKAKYGTQLNVEKIRADLAINREVLKGQVDVINEG